LIFVSSNASALDMRQSDKQLHFAVSYGATLTMYHFTKNKWIAGLSTLGVGALKELLDKDKTDSWDDLSADALGVGLGIAVINIEF
jgi:hypothetical protein